MKGGSDCATHAEPVELEGGAKKGKMKYADAKTRAGKNRQVWEGAAEMTGPGCLKKKDLVKSKTGKIVSKKMVALLSVKLVWNVSLLQNLIKDWKR